jgi:hypothetical protein
MSVRFVSFRFPRIIILLTNNQSQSCDFSSLESQRNIRKLKMRKSRLIVDEKGKKIPGLEGESREEINTN